MLTTSARGARARPGHRHCCASASSAASTARGLAYLDYTGSALYGDSQLRSHHALLARWRLRQSALGERPVARQQRRSSRGARADVLRFFDADPDRYAVCFTANTSAAIKLVAESYPFGRDERAGRYRPTITIP